MSSSELFGINVFKVIEILKLPQITRVCNPASGMMGMVSLRGEVIPVFDLGKTIGFDDQAGELMIVIQCNRRTMGFCIHSVDHIVRIDAEDVHPIDGVPCISAVVRIEKDQLVSILDVESVLQVIYGDEESGSIARLPSPANVFFVDDSMVARRKIIEVLDAMGAEHSHAVNGREAFERLSLMPPGDKPALVLIDAEMPEMSGYDLARKLKEEKVFSGPIVMHSSMPVEINRIAGDAAGIDAYVTKFSSVDLAHALSPYLQRSVSA